MKTRTPLIAMALCVNLIGCAVQQPARSPTGWTDAEIGAAFAAQETRCAQSLLDPRIDPIRKHIPLSNNATPTIEQLASKKKPNAAEKEALLVLDTVVTTCADEKIKIYKDSGAPSIYSDQYQDLSLASKQAKARLWAGQITFGEYLNALTENNRNADERLRAQLDKMRANEIQQAQLAAQQQQANAQTLMLFNQASARYRKPVQTNCVRFGSQTSCTSY